MLWNSCKKTDTEQPIYQMTADLLKKRAFCFIVISLILSGLSLTLH